MRRQRKRQGSKAFPRMVIGLMGLVCVVGTIAAFGTEEKADAPPPVTEETVKAVMMAMEIGAEDDGEAPDEAERIEAALLAQGYFREDVPLAFQEQDCLHTACEEFGVAYELMLGLIDHETSFHNVTGDNGESLGYCQIQPRWWSGLMEEIGADDLMAPYDNFRTGCAILSGLVAEYGDLPAALTAYNAGHDTGGRSYANEVIAAAEGWGWSPNS